MGLGKNMHRNSTQRATRAQDHTLDLGSVLLASYPTDLSTNLFYESDALSLKLSGLADVSTIKNLV